MAISQITSKSITDSTITSDDIATGAVESSMTTQIGGRRNLIINGGQTIWQRGTSFTTPATDAYVSDRWQQGAEFGSIDVSRSTDTPDGFGYSLKIDVNSTGNPASSGQQVVLQQKIEAQDLQGVGFGTSGAQAMTMTFWVKCAITGTFPVWFYRPDNARHFAAHYTIDAVDTWEKKTISIPADTSGTLPVDNGEGLRVRFALDSDTLYTGGIPSAWEAINNDRYGSMTTTFMETASNYIQFTGVQLEVGTVATPFEHRSYGEELALCQRYYAKIAGGANGEGLGLGAYYASDSLDWYITHPVEMRSTATLDLVTGTSYFIVYRNGSSDAFNNIRRGGGNISTRMTYVYAGGVDGISGTAGHAGTVSLNSASAYVALDAEL